MMRTAILLVALHLTGTWVRGKRRVEKYLPSARVTRSSEYILFFADAAVTGTKYWRCADGAALDREDSPPLSLTLLYIPCKQRFDSNNLCNSSVRPPSVAD